MHDNVRARLLRIAIILLVTGVAWRPAAAQRAGENGGAIDLKSGRFANVFSTEPARAPDTLATTDAQVFAVLPKVFEAIGVPLSVVDTSSKVMGALRVPVRRPIGGQRLSLLLECGTGSYGPNAERYTVQITLLAAVRAVDAGHTEVQTRVEGNASPNGLSTVVKCMSTGRLEDRFTELLKKELGL